MGWRISEEAAVDKIGGDLSLSSAMKMRGSVWGVLAALVASLLFIVFFPGNDTPENKVLWDCARREIHDHYSGERPAGHVPQAAFQAATAKCQRELRAK